MWVESKERRYLRRHKQVRHIFRPPILRLVFFIRWDKDGRQSQAACWLVFLGKHNKAIDILMRSKGNAAHSEYLAFWLTRNGR